MKFKFKGVTFEGDQIIGNKFTVKVTEEDGSNVSMMVDPTKYRGHPSPQAAFKQACRDYYRTVLRTKIRERRWMKEIVTSKEDLGEETE